MRRSVPGQRQAVRPRPDDRPAPGCDDDRHACPCRRNPCIPLLPAGCRRATGRDRDPAGHRDPRRRAGTHRGPLPREHQPRRKGVDRGSHRCLRACRNVRAAAHHRAAFTEEGTGHLDPGRHPRRGAGRPERGGCRHRRHRDARANTGRSCCCRSSIRTATRATGVTSTSPCTPRRSTGRASATPRISCRRQTIRRGRARPPPRVPRPRPSRPGSSLDRRTIPAIISLDLHEDNLIDEGYVYSQGVRGAAEELAITAVGVLRDEGVPIKMDGKTRFDEPVERGIIGPVADSSIDELMSARQVIVDGNTRPGPGAETVLVLETPAAALPLAQRVAAQAALLRLLSKYLRHHARRLLTERMQPTARPQVTVRRGHRPHQRRRARRGRGLLPRSARAPSRRRQHAGAARRAARQDGPPRSRRRLPCARSIEAAPTFAKPAEDLGYLLVSTGRAADALPFLERATQLDPSLERAWFSLGKALAQARPRQGGRRRVREVLRALARAPRLMALAAEHQKEGRLEEAERIYRRVLRREPEERRCAAPARADRQPAAGHADDAESMLQQAIRDRARTSCSRSSISVSCTRSRTASPRHSPASTASIALEPSQPQAHFQRAATLARASFTPEALAGYRRCLELRAQACRRPARAGPRAQGGRRLRRGRRRVQRLHRG